MLPAPRGWVILAPLGNKRGNEWGCWPVASPAVMHDTLQDGRHSADRQLCNRQRHHHRHRRPVHRRWAHLQLLWFCRAMLCTAPAGMVNCWQYPAAETRTFRGWLCFPERLPPPFCINHPPSRSQRNRAARPARREQRIRAARHPHHRHHRHRAGHQHRPGGGLPGGGRVAERRRSPCNLQAAWHTTAAHPADMPRCLPRASHSPLPLSLSPCCSTPTVPAP